MNYDLFIHPRVYVEAKKVMIHRESDRPGTGESFVQELDRCILTIKIRPEAFPKRKGNIR